MQPNKWINTRTKQEVGVNSVLGTPRSWVSRAIGFRNPDPNLHETTINPKEITVGGIWYRPCDLPNTGDQYAIYRFFRLDPKFNGHGIGERPQPAIGLGVAVPSSQILTWCKQFKDSGAVWIWWNWQNKSTKIMDVSKILTTPQTKQASETPRPTRKNSRLDHDLMFDMFSKGHTIESVAKATDSLKNSVQYVWEKWQKTKEQA